MRLIAQGGRELSPTHLVLSLSKKISCNPSDSAAIFMSYVDRLHDKYSTFVLLVHFSFLEQSTTFLFILSQFVSLLLALLQFEPEDFVRKRRIGFVRMAITGLVALDQ